LPKKENQQKMKHADILALGIKNKTLNGTEISRIFEKLPKKTNDGKSVNCAVF
jgi:hypothetical protein